MTAQHERSVIAAFARPAAARTTPPSPNTDVFRDDQFRRLARELEAHVGLRLPDNKKDMVEGRLRRRARDLGLASLEAYGAHLFEDGYLTEEFEAIVDCVTTNKTDFFREADHFDILSRMVVPNLLGGKSQNGSIKIWSAACSTGAESFTLAMVLAELRARRPFEFSVLGTDINSQVLETAVRAVYPNDAREPIPPALRSAYTMDAIDSKRREFRMVPELRSRVSFSRLNLMDENFGLPRDFDVIFCRNVLIYFDRLVQQAVIGRLLRHLKPTGYLFLGHSEAMAG